MNLFIYITSLVLLFTLSACKKKQKLDECKPFTHTPSEVNKKMNGITLWMDEFAPHPNDFQIVNDVHANWVALVPYCYVSSDTGGIDYDRQNYWYGFTLDGLKQYITDAKAKGQKVFVKPHVWVESGAPGTWHGDLNFSSEANWRKFETTYFDYIQDIIKISDSLEVDAFALGVELRSFVANRPSYWNMMIDSCKQLFKGQLTYCANWDDYTQVSFWNKLNFIGIDAYFTISSAQQPTIQACKNGLIPIKSTLKNFHDQYNKPIVFTEFGFQSRDYAGFQPWNGSYNNNVNQIGQANAYKAVFETFWEEDWFGGGFSWLWHMDTNSLNGLSPIDYSPQNKLAETVISDYYNQ